MAPMDGASSKLPLSASCTARSLDPQTCSPPPQGPPAQTPPELPIHPVVQLAARLFFSAATPHHLLGFLAAQSLVHPCQVPTVNANKSLAARLWPTLAERTHL